MNPRRRPIAYLAAIALAAVAVAATAGASAAQGLAFRTCPEDPSMGCATLRVPLDHDNPARGTLDLAVQRKKGKGATKGVLVMLSGGPGQAAVPISPLDPLMNSMPTGWDFLAIDTRGTGKGALKCAAFDNPDDAVDNTTATATCAAQVGPNRAFYTSRQVAMDLEDLRVGLGRTTMAVGGISYGTYEAQYYATLFPTSVDHLVLDSVVDPASRDGLELSSFQATSPVLRALCAAGNCAGITTDPVGDLARLVQKTANAPIRGRGTRTNGTPVTTSVGGPNAQGELPAIFAEGDMNPGVRSLWPGAVKAAVVGDAGPLIRIRALVSAGTDMGSPERFSEALWEATICSDDSPLYSSDDPLDVRTAKLDAAYAALPPDAFAPFSEANARPDASALNCLGWPESGTDPLPVGPLPAVPTIVLSGGQDTRTPTSGALAVASRSPQATVVLAPGAGHDLVDWYNCADQQVNRLLRGLPVQAGACRGITPTLTSPAFPAPKATVAQWSPMGAPGTAGRVVHAARFSVQDAIHSVEAAIQAGLGRLQGVRAGTMTPSSTSSHVTYRFRGYSDTNGVSVTGTLTAAGQRVNGRLAVQGPGAYDGWVELHNDGRRTWYSGQVGPSTVRITLR